MSGLIHRYREHLPITESTPVITLCEGDTPLIPAPDLAKRAGQGRQVFLKFEGLNPTASFKDRGMTLAISKAMEESTTGVICASTGNTSASAAAYAARAGIPCWVILPAGKVAAGKLAQALMHGARIVAIDGNFDQALDLVRQSAKARGLTLVNSVNPYRIEGQKTIAFEIVDELGGPPDAHFLPVGNAGNITATWRGYREYRELGRTDRTPSLHGFQAAGAAPLVSGAPVEHPSTVATAIRIGNPASWKGAEDAVAGSGGSIDAVTDEEILAAQRHLAEVEGVFCEPASAASVAGLLKRIAADRIPAPAEGTIVCTLTGHGLKDPEIASRDRTWPDPIPARLEALLEVMAS